MTGGVDGLACVFDVGAAADEEEALSGVLSVGPSVARLGFYGGTHPGSPSRLWVLTGTEELSLWDWADAARAAAAPDTRAALGAAAAAAGAAGGALNAPDYLIRCEWDAAAQQLWLLAGTQAGAVAAFPVGAADAALGPPALLLQGGHVDVVRAVEWRPERGAARGALTGGEDSRLCAWAMQSEPGGGEGAAAGATHGVARRSPSSEGQRYSPY